MDTANPNLLQAQFPDDVLRSVYWRERAAHHIMPVQRDDEEALARALTVAAQHIVNADAILFVTGAGAGVDMGLPDFRTSNKFWEQLKHPGILKYEDASDCKLFETEPEFAWGLNFHQLSQYRTAPVHDGYKAMLQLAALKQNNYFCYTTNIDGVLQRAGFADDRVLEIHGNIHRLQCTRYSCTDAAGQRDVWDDPVSLQYDPQTCLALDKSALPICRHCGGLARPNVWFCSDTDYVLSARSSAMSSAYAAWTAAQQGRRVVVVELGAGLAIPSARVEAEDQSQQLAGVLVRINPVDCMVPGAEGPRACSYRAVSIPLGAAEACVRLLDLVRALIAASP